MTTTTQPQTTAELQARWHKIRVANIYDTLDKMGYGNQCLDLGIRPLFPHQRLAGQVITAQGSAYPVGAHEQGTAWTGGGEDFFQKLRTIAQFQTNCPHSADLTAARAYFRAVKIQSVRRPRGLNNERAGLTTNARFLLTSLARFRVVDRTRDNFFNRIIVSRLCVFNCRF